MALNKNIIERIELQFDGRPWSIGYSAHEPTQGAATEYVLPGETVEAWTELVTVELLPRAQRRADVNELVEATHDFFARSCLQLYWRILKRQKQEVLYEWRHAGSPQLGQPPQHEISRYVKGETGIHRAAYVVKSNPMPEPVREQWVKLIGQGKLVKLTAPYTTSSRTSTPNQTSPKWRAKLTLLPR